MPARTQNVVCDSLLSKLVSLLISRQRGSAILVSTTLSLAQNQQCQQTRKPSPQLPVLQFCLLGRTTHAPHHDFDRTQGRTITLHSRVDRRIDSAYPARTLPCAQRRSASPSANSNISGMLSRSREATGLISHIPKLTPTN